MTTLKIVIDEGDKDGEGYAEIEGIPTEAWQRFKENAKVQFPKSGDDAWASFLSEVIVAGSGGDGENVTYFMTGVPITYAQAIQRLFQQVELSWEQFHAILLQTAVLPDQFRITRFHGEHKGIFIALGLDPAAFANMQDKTQHSFEVVMSTLLAAAASGTITFSPDTTYLEPKSVTPTA